MRDLVPRRSLAAFARPPGVDPVAIVAAQDEGRVPALVPLRHARMLASPFAFLRGAAAVMIADIAPASVTGAAVVACGDMHVSNFGLYASAERNLVFAINDFDNTCPGAWEWDVKRLAASAAVVTRSLGGSDDRARDAARAAARSYRERMAGYAGMTPLETWYDRIDEEQVLRALPAALQASTRALLISRTWRKGHQRAFRKLVEHTPEGPRFRDLPPRLLRERATLDGRPPLPAAEELMHAYRASLPEAQRHLLGRYRLMDVARKVVGVGSVGTDCWVALLLSADGDPLLLQIKEARPSVVAPFAPREAYQVAPRHQGQRVVTGQRLIQGAPDIFLGWASGFGGRSYYVRQLADMEGGVPLDPDALKGIDDYAALCGWALALAHAKSGDAAVIDGYCGAGERLDAAVARFAMTYADQTEADHATFVAAVRQGRLAAATPGS